VDIFRIAHEKLPYPYLVIDGQKRLLDFNIAASEKFCLIEKYKEKPVPLIVAKLNTKGIEGNIFKPLLKTLDKKREYNNYKLKIVNLDGQTELLFASTFLVTSGNKVMGAYAFFNKSVLHLKSIPESIESKCHLNFLEQTGTIKCLTKMIAAKDPYTVGHCKRVAYCASLLAKKLGLKEEKVYIIYLAGLLHDIGKIWVPETILTKPSRLTKEEFETIKLHPAKAVDILKCMPGIQAILPIIYHHHERWDGNGYPKGLKGAEIPLGSRILAIADAFEAMTSDRSYRRRFTVHKAIQEIIKNRGKQFDPDIADVFLEIVQKSPASVL